MRNPMFKDKSEEKSLLQLLDKQDLNNLKSIFAENGSSINMKLSFGGTALHLAAYKLYIPAITLFFSLGAKVNETDEYGRTPLHYIHYNNKASNLKEIAEILLSSGADVNLEDQGGNTPLHYAVEAGSLDLVELYLKHNAELNKKNERDVIPLVNAIDHENVEMVRFLVNQGSDVNNINKTGDRTPVSLARRKGNSRIIECLLANGADASIANNFGETPLHYAIDYNYHDLISLFLKYNVNVNVKNSRDETPIIRAILYDNIELIKKLIELGADVNNIDTTEYRTPLILACRRRSIEIVECLLANGANPDEVDAGGFSPLIIVLRLEWCYGEKTTFLVKLLLTHGADINILCPNGWNVLNVHRSKDCSNLLLEQVAKLQEFEVPVHLDIIHTITSNSGFSNYLNQCRQELSKAKKTKLRNCWVTFFNILTDDEKNLVKYAGNQDLIKDFEKSNLLQDFPVFGCEMQERLSKGVRVRELWDSAAVKLSDTLMIFNPTHLIIRDILNCLLEKDLSKLKE